MIWFDFAHRLELVEGWSGDGRAVSKEGLVISFYDEFCVLG